MRQPVTENHKLDVNGNQAGGTTEGVGIKIDWQDGPLGRDANRKEPNGAFVEGVIAAAIGRLKFYNSGKFSCRETRWRLRIWKKLFTGAMRGRGTGKIEPSKGRT